MRKIYLLIALLTITLVVAACATTNRDESPVQNDLNVEENGLDEKDDMDGTDDINDRNETHNTTETEGTNEGTETNSNQDLSVGNQNDMQTKVDELDYVDFDLDIEYADHKDYEVELEKNSNNSVEAKIEDSFNNVKKKGTEAFEEIYPLVKQLTIDQQTSKEDAIKETIDIFGLPADYQEFELEIRFKDGTKIEFADKK